MRIVGLVQSRMGSSRLPGKNGLPICGKPQIWHVLNRLKRVALLDDLMLVIPWEPNGKVQVDAAHELGVDCLNYRGNPNDVLKRHVIAAEAMNADLVVRVPGDNTFVDPDEVSRMIRAYIMWGGDKDKLASNLDLNVLGNGYPAGLGCEVYDVRFLRWLDDHTYLPRHREHPHLWAYENHKVRTIPCPADIRRPWMAFSVNTPEQFAWTADIYAHLYPDNPNFGVRDVFKFLDQKEATWPIATAKTTQITLALT